MDSKHCYISFIILSNLLSVSCSVETLSPVKRADSSQTPNAIIRNFGDNHYQGEREYNGKIPTEKVKYIYDISEMISVFPNFHSPDIDTEIRELKIALQYYIYSTIEGDGNRKRESYKSYAKSYNQLQRLKNHLEHDEDVELINQYLIRIRTSVNSLEYLK